MGIREFFLWLISTDKATVTGWDAVIVSVVFIMATFIIIKVAFVLEEYINL